MERYETDAYQVGKHPRRTTRLAHVIFCLLIFFSSYIFDLLVTVRVSKGFLSLFAFP